MCARLLIEPEPIPAHSRQRGGRFPVQVSAGRLITKDLFQMSGRNPRGDLLRCGWGTPAEATVAGMVFAGRPGDSWTAAVAPLLAPEVCAPYRARMRGLVARTCVLPAEEPRDLQGLLWMARQ